MTRKALSSDRRALLQDSMESLDSIKGKKFRELPEHQSFAQCRKRVLYLQPSDNSDTAYCAPQSNSCCRGRNLRQRLGGWRPGWRALDHTQQIWQFLKAAVITSNVSYSVFVFVHLTTLYHQRTVYVIKWSVSGWLSEVWMWRYRPAGLENLKENHESIWRNYWTL